MAIERALVGRAQSEAPGTPRNFIRGNRETSEMLATNVSRRTAGESSGPYGLPTVSTTAVRPIFRTVFVLDSLVLLLDSLVESRIQLAIYENL
jgi:hypothetical protein